jgi:hypothetical protein
VANYVRKKSLDILRCLTDNKDEKVGDIYVQKDKYNTILSCDLRRAWKVMEAAGRNWVYLATLSGLGAAALYVAMGPSATDKRALRRRRRRGYPPGLVNLGNTCFVNATLQALAAAPAFRCWLAAVVPALQARTSDSRKEDGKVDSKGSSRNDGVAKALSDVLNVLGGDQPADDNVEGLSAKPVLDALRFHGWSISPDQHDALEVLNVSGSIRHPCGKRLPRIAMKFNAVNCSA